MAACTLRNTSLIFFADFVASDFSFGRTLAADFAPLDCSGRQFVSTDWVEVHVKT